jgi:hypothetical protein
MWQYLSGCVIIREWCRSYRKLRNLSFGLPNGDICGIATAFLNIILINFRLIFSNYPVFINSETENPAAVVTGPLLPTIPMHPLSHFCCQKGRAGISWEPCKIVAPHNIMSTTPPRLSLFTYLFYGARGRVVGLGSMLQAGRSRVWFPLRSLDFSIDLILPAAVWPWGQLIF